MPVACVTGEPIRFGDPGVIHGAMCAQLGEQRAVAVHHALRVARRARRVREHAHVVGVGGGDRSPCGRRASSTTSHPTRRTSRCAARRPRPDDDVQREIGELVGRRAVDDVEVVDVAVPVGGDVRARPALREDEAHLLGPVDVHDRHEHVAAHREAVERDDGLAPVRQLERDDVAGFECRRRRARRRAGAPRRGCRRRCRARAAISDQTCTVASGAARSDRSTRRAERVVGPPALGEVALAERRRHRSPSATASCHGDLRSA